MTCQNGEMHLEGESFPQVEETCLVGLPYESVPTTVSHFPNLFCQYWNITYGRLANLPEVLNFPVSESIQETFSPDAIGKHTFLHWHNAKSPAIK